MDNQRPIETVRLSDVQKHITLLMKKFGDARTNVVQLTVVDPHGKTDRKILFHIIIENDYGVR